MKLLYISIFFLFIVFSSNAQITTLTLQPGSTGIDARVLNLTPTSNYGTMSTMLVRKQGTALDHSFILFDLTSIPSQAIVITASLTLYGTSHSGTNAAYCRKNTSSWVENTVNWNTAPTTSTVGQIPLAQSTSSTQTYVLDVKNFVQEMVNIPAANYGWTLIKQDETTNNGTLTFATSDHPTSSLWPKLEISYCMPIDIKAYMTPATTPTSTTGGLSTEISGGVSPYTYLWSDGSTDKNLFNKIPGVYSFTVTDSVGNVAKKDYIIAAENVSMTFTITPDNLSGIDGIIQQKDLGGLENDNFKDLNLLKSERGNASGWFVSRSLFYYDLFNIPPNAIIDTAIINLYGAGHNTATRPNNSAIYINTSAWTEPTLTWSVQPTHTTASYSVPIAATTSTNENRSLNLTPMVKYWVQNPTQNYGAKMMLTSESTMSVTSMVFGSSDNATAALRPQLVIALKVPITNYVVLKTIPDGGYYLLKSNKLYVQITGEYAAYKITYNIYDYKHSVVFSSNTTPVNVYPSTNLYPGDNRITFDFNSVTLAAGYYTLEVINEKNEKKYLRFKK